MDGVEVLSDEGVATEGEDVVVKGRARKRCEHILRDQHRVCRGIATIAGISCGRSNNLVDAPSPPRTLFCFVR